jgi:hypothetical protein
MKNSVFTNYEICIDFISVSCIFNNALERKLTIVYNTGEQTSLELDFDIRQAVLDQFIEFKKDIVQERVLCML